MTDVEGEAKAAFITINTYRELPGIEEDIANEDNCIVTQEQDAKQTERHFQAPTPLASSDDLGKTDETDGESLSTRIASSLTISRGWVEVGASAASAAHRAGTKLVLEIASAAKRACEKLTKVIHMATAIFDRRLPRARNPRGEGKPSSTREEALSDIMSYLDGLILQYSSQQWAIPDLGGLLST